MIKARRNNQLNVISLLAICFIAIFPVVGVAQNAQKKIHAQKEKDTLILDTDSPSPIADETVINPSAKKRDSSSTRTPWKKQTKPQRATSTK